MNTSYDSSKRRFPRRPLLAPVGILLNGEYRVYPSFDVGERGVGIMCDRPMDKNQQVVVCFFINHGCFVVCRGEVRFCRAEGSGFRLGFEFTNIRFEDRRTIREYIAFATETASDTGRPVTG